MYKLISRRLDGTEWHLSTVPYIWACNSIGGIVRVEREDGAPLSADEERAIAELRARGLPAGLSPDHGQCAPGWRS